MATAKLDASEVWKAAKAKIADIDRQEAAEKEAWLAAETGQLVNKGGLWRSNYRITTREDAEAKFNERGEVGSWRRSPREWIEFRYVAERGIASKILRLARVAHQKTAFHDANIGDGFIILSDDEAAFLRLGSKT
ncbi:hypothetical protein QBK99_12635 [Corticibacterium sp. UT-5YL-CI-8]|nr:hypothetical protein [Tianweitania sp. UT-5YL-CI-8]